MNQDFLHELKSRDSRAFDHLVEEHSPKIFSVCLQYLADENSAEDMVQETFIKAYQNIENFSGVSDIGTWLYRIAINTCMEELRKRKSKKRSTTYNVLARTEQESEYWKDSLYDENYVEEQIIQTQDREALYRAIHQLSDDQQAAFVMYYLDEKNVKEVATVLEKSESAVQALLHRARTQMKILLYDHYQNNHS